MILIEPFGGLANRLRVIASATTLNKSSTDPVVCIWNEDNELNAPFNQLFKEFPELNIISKSKKYNFVKATNQQNQIKRLIAKSINRWIGIDYCIKQPDFKNLIWSKKINLQEIASAHKKLYIHTCENFNSDLDQFKKFAPCQLLEEKIAKITENFDAHTIGIHIRRTDNNKSIEFSPIELFIEKMNFEIEKNTATKFFLATDDAETENLLKNKFGERIISTKKTINRDTLEGMQDATIDLFCLSKTSKIYGSYWSSFSLISSYIGGISKETLSNRP